MNSFCLSLSLCRTHWSNRRRRGSWCVRAPWWRWRYDRNNFLFSTLNQFRWFGTNLWREWKLKRGNQRTRVTKWEKDKDTGGSGGIQRRLRCDSLSASWYKRSKTVEYRSFSLQTERDSLLRRPVLLFRSREERIGEWGVIGVRGVSNSDSNPSILEEGSSEVHEKKFVWMNFLCTCFGSSRGVGPWTPPCQTNTIWINSTEEEWWQNSLCLLTLAD